MSVEAEVAELEDISVYHEGLVGMVVLDRPPVNAFRTQTFEELTKAFETLNDDPSCSVVVIKSANPKVFCAGADISELPFTADMEAYRARLTRRLFHIVMRAPQPVICAVAGPAIGGGSVLASASDILIATETASFRVPEITMARCGAARHLMRVAPQGMVRRAYFTGTPISAQDAYRVGMVSELVSDAEALEAAAMSLAAEITAHSPVAVRAAKEALDLAEELPIEAGYHVEQQFTLQLANTVDAAEAASAFREKRTPQWPSRSGTTP
jgi:enoyl-CoA hydratase